VETARKRKAETGTEGEGQIALEDVPDAEEEMHAPDAIGSPPRERVEPLVRPSPSMKRSSEEGSPEGSKKAKADETKGQGTKRALDPTQDERTFKQLMDEIKQDQKRSKDASSSSASASTAGRPERAQATKDVASILQSRIMASAPEEEVLEIGQLLMSMSGSKVDVAEIYNPKRFTSQANRFGLRPGFAIDLTLCKNEQGEHWDLSKKEDQKMLRELQRKEKPALLIGSPPCGPFSPLQNLSKNKRTPEQNAEILAEGKTHLKVATDAYLEQHRNDRFFLHEHPKPSSSWEEDEIKRLTELEGIYLVESPMCHWHMTSEDNEGIGYVRKQTMWLTNSKELAKTLEKKCSGMHRHVQLINGRAKHAQVYPPKLVSAILRGIRQELRNAGELSALSELVAGPCPDDTGNEQTEEFFDPDNVPEGEYYDSVTGIVLDPEKVRAARNDEMNWVEKQQLWETVDEKICWEETNRAPIILKWVDRNKGDEAHPNYRSRLVVREVKKASKPLAEFESFSAMPPLEALKVLCSLMTSKRTSTHGKPYKMMLIDISRAHFYGLAKRRVFCRLPEGHEQAGKCALLRKSMYGTLDAASIWQATYVELLKECGIEQCVGWPALFMHKERDLRFMVHGDDFVALGDEDGLKFLEEKLKQKFEYRVDGLLGPGPQDGTSMCVLNRVLSFDKTSGILNYEADARHAEYIIKALGLEEGKSVATPAEKQKADEVSASENLPTLEKEEATLYRSLTMRAAYLSSDRADISEAVKSLARHMQAPTSYSWAKLKRLGRYLVGKPRVVYQYKPQRMYNAIRVFCDSDHAGDLRTRRSTTGIVCMLGSHCIKHSSNLQSTVSLSSGESEFYALVKAGCVGLGLKTMMSEWGLPLNLILYSDSSAARGIVSRKGLGKTRHVQSRYLWIQEKVGSKELAVEAVGTDNNLADLCTKPLTADQCWKHMARMGQKAVDGRHAQAKQLV
jgi:hypothetical protein